MAPKKGDRPSKRKCQLASTTQEHRGPQFSHPEKQYVQQKSEERAFIGIKNLVKSLTQKKPNESSNLTKFQVLMNYSREFLSKPGEYVATWSTSQPRKNQEN